MTTLADEIERLAKLSAFERENVHTARWHATIAQLGQYVAANLPAILAALRAEPAPDAVERGEG